MVVIALGRDGAAVSTFDQHPSSSKRLSRGSGRFGGALFVCLKTREDSPMSDDFEISLDAPQRVRDALQRIGRSEDVSFSPRQSSACPRLLRPQLHRNRRCRHHHAADRPHVTLTDVAEYSSPCLMTPHGVDFLDNETVLVANR